ncbi:hypothetical protein M501DRAFT_1040566 [Patellaria atrata CBS 101060]|uniref:F-box domain-containing protein n=1 Tax=Patellaria atrata CBS 101060 TaxID=1346257 RepID=A0A9P4VP94_9PEZI|nr:hypothetical protein M501DRAFT_1040566 [Patellaria atrata CBS 101060]
MATSNISLLSLPKDILIALPEYLHDIEDFKNISSTCRALRSLFSKTHPSTIFHLAVAASRIFFRPSPEFLVAAVSRELGDWARQSPTNAALLKATLKEGNQGLLSLALKHTPGISMSRVRALHILRFSAINPTADLIDKCVGKQWYATPNFWTGGVDDAYTIYADPDLGVFHLATYGGLFAGDFDIFLDPALPPEEKEARMLGVDTRLEFVKYCIPDAICIEGLDAANDIRDDSAFLDPRRNVDPVGPYAAFAALGEGYGQGFDFRTQNQLALLHTLRSRRFRHPWKAVRDLVGGDFEEERSLARGREEDLLGWRQEVWEAIVLTQGLEGLGMLWGAVENWRGRLEEWRRRVQGLDAMPRRVEVGWQHTWEYPLLRGDLRVVTSGHVLGT